MDNQKHTSAPAGGDSHRPLSMKERLLAAKASGRDFRSQGQIILDRMKEIGLSMNELESKVLDKNGKPIPSDRLRTYLENQEAIPLDSTYVQIKHALNWNSEQAKPLKEAIIDLQAQLDAQEEKILAAGMQAMSELDFGGAPHGNGKPSVEPSAEQSTPHLTDAAISAAANSASSRITGPAGVLQYRAAAFDHQDTTEILRDIRRRVGGSITPLGALDAFEEYNQRWSDGDSNVQRAVLEALNGLFPDDAAYENSAQQAPALRDLRILLERVNAQLEPKPSAAEHPAVQGHVARLAEADKAAADKIAAEQSAPDTALIGKAGAALKALREKLPAPDRSKLPATVTGKMPAHPTEKELARVIVAPDGDVVKDMESGKKPITDANVATLKNAYGDEAATEISALEKAVAAAAPEWAKMPNTAQVAETRRHRRRR